MSLDWEDQCVLDLDTDSVVQPYMFEPLPRNAAELSEAESSSDSEPEEQEEDVPVSIWCTCDNCESMNSKTENKCCRDYPALQDLLASESIQCITDHEGFIGNCLNKFVLEASMYEFVHENGALGDDELLHKKMRYLAYRRFTRWVYGILGKKNRKVIPACAVHRIRNQFPGNFYHGFRFPIY